MNTLLVFIIISVFAIGCNHPDAVSREGCFDVIKAYEDQLEANNRLLVLIENGYKRELDKQDLQIVDLELKLEQKRSCELKPFNKKE